MSEKDKDKSPEKSEQKDENLSDDKIKNEYDVILDVPKVNANSLKIDSENFNFSISVKAQLGNFTNIEIGTNIHIDKIKMDIDGLEAEALFKVKLKKIENIFLNALKELDENPQLLKHAESINKKLESNKED